MVKEKEKKVKEKDKKVSSVKKTEKNSKKEKPKKAKQKPLTTFKAEFKKIKWPTRKEMVKYSIAVVVFVIFFALFFFAIQNLMSFIKSLI